MTNFKISNGLCQDLMIEIFTRLPVKSLLRFRSVSKSLCSCIGSPDFIRLHTLRSPEKLMIIHELNREGVDNSCSLIYTLHSEGQLSSSPYTSVTAVECPFTEFQIVGSSNGIICLFELGKGISLWNPSTRRKLTAQDRPSWIHTSIPSEGRSSYHVFGFGYDPIMDDYKILRYSKPNKQKVYSVYTLKTDTWCEIHAPATPYSYLDSRQCLFEGTLHWIAKYESPRSGGSKSSYHIMTFDLSTDVFSASALPEPSWDTSQVTIIKGNLAVISSDNIDDTTWIWVRREEYSDKSYSWSVAFKFQTPGVLLMGKSWYQDLHVTADGDFLLNILYKGIFIYNPATRVQSRVEKFRGSNHVTAMEKCVEGLGLLHMATWGPHAKGGS